MTPHEFTLLVYNISLLPIIFFSILFVLFSLINYFVDNKEKTKYGDLDELPFVSVQIPTFNDPVGERCIKKCMDFDYPKNRYEIIIVDDSTDKDTQRILKKYSSKHPKLIKYIHRDNREGFKAGALRNAMKITKGDIIVIFDADWIPKKDFISKVVKPFSDDKVAVVQTRQGFYNKDSNLITRFAAYMLMIYHTIIMPINNKVNCVFFCGTAGAIRRKMFDEVGGWNLSSVTEDSDLTVKLLLKGYKSVYLDYETPSEVPSTFEAFIKQQMRWCYGNVRAFFDNAFKILFNKRLSIKQRALVVYVTLSTIIAPLVVVMTLFGLIGWFIGEPTLFNIQDFVDLSSRLAFTLGFIVMGGVTLHKRKKISEFPYLLFSAFTLGLVLAVANTVAFLKAVVNMKLHWFCTTKDANTSFA